MAERHYESPLAMGAEAFASTADVLGCCLRAAGAGAEVLEDSAGAVWLLLVDDVDD